MLAKRHIVRVRGVDLCEETACVSDEFQRYDETGC